MMRRYRVIRPHQREASIVDAPSADAALAWGGDGALVGMARPDIAGSRSGAHRVLDADGSVVDPIAEDGS